MIKYNLINILIIYIYIYIIEMSFDKLMCILIYILYKRFRIIMQLN